MNKTQSFRWTQEHAGAASSAECEREEEPRQTAELPGLQGAAEAVPSLD